MKLLYIFVLTLATSIVASALPAFEFTAFAQSQLSAPDLSPKAGPTYPVIQLPHLYAGENQPGFQGKHPDVHYMDANERETIRVIIHDGFVYDSHGNPYQAPSNKLMWTMDGSGNFYLFNQKGHPELRHSSVFAGGPVACAGEIFIVDGRITQINRDSGHYDPQPKHLQNAMSELKLDGVDTGAIQELQKK